MVTDNIEGKLKNGIFKIGDGYEFSGRNLPRGEVVVIIDSEDHPIFGKRYKIKGFNEWFEANCFEYVVGE